MSTMEWQGLEHALECFVLKFDGAVEIIAEINESCARRSSAVNRVRKDFPRDVSERAPPRSRSIGPALTVYS